MMSDKTIVSRNYILSWPIYCPPPFSPPPSARPLRLKCKYVWLDQEAHPIYTNPHRRFLMKTRFFSFPPKLPPPPQPLCRRTQLQLPQAASVAPPSDEDIDLDDLTELCRRTNADGTVDDRCYLLDCPAGSPNCEPQ